MPIAHDLQDMLADVTAAIAGGKTFGRTELTVLQRRLTAVRRDAARDERDADRTRAALSTIADGIDAGVANLVGLAAHVRALQPAGAEAQS